jgi:tetratricopeptide (TPR) repeat protein
MARAKFLNGDTDEAFAILKRAIDAQPQRFEAYAAMASFYREQHNLDLALKTVNEANDATNGDSAEILYTLGLLNLEAGNVDAAVTCARKAYAMGYPLPGLATKLTKLGRWPDKQADQQPAPHQ